jgi:ribonucleoside-diphosphate reductase alpha chain
MDVVEVPVVPAMTNKIDFTPHFTKGQHAFDTVTWVRRDAVLVGADGKEKFRQNDVEVPDWWNDTTVNIVAEKYFRVVGGVKESSAKQMFHRVAFWITKRGIEQNVLEGEYLRGSVGGTHGESCFGGPAEIFYQELLYMFVHGMHAFNSPVWFNVGVQAIPQCSACFIQEVEDTMESIVDLATKEVMLFKGGSGTGSNLSPLRSSWEKLSGGGRPSGPVSFMKMFDKGAGVTKSGGTTRRAAKMVVLNVDHPDILEQSNGEVGFIGCKAHAEKIAADLYSTGKYTAEWNVPGNVYDLVDYQNANNSVRVTDWFMEAVQLNQQWITKAVKTGADVKSYSAQAIYSQIAEAAWYCGDPGIQFDTSTNDWHTCKESGRINASNPCSEYLFLDDTACNLSSLNLTRFAEGKGFDIDGFIHACELAITAKEIIVDASSYPSERIAERSHQFRTLGLGYTNLGALLTLWGLPYDSNEGRTVAGAITAVMTGAAYRMSARLAEVKGPFPEYEKNKDSMLEVIRKHWDAAKRLPSTIVKEWRELISAAYELWSDAYELGLRFGYRNAQVTVIAPTGTISFLMGADTTAIEPMLALVVYKKLVGEGTVKLPNGIVEQALKNLGYSSEAIASILQHVKLTEKIHTAAGFDSAKHGPIFAEALGQYALRPEAHVDMMVAVQPFISGGISKTVNMPKECTPKDIADIYTRAWKGGLKCVAVYRDGCKLSQPISTKLTDAGKRQEKLEWGQRRKMPETRPALNHKFEVQGFEGYLSPGFYEDGSLAEIFIQASKEGSTLSGMLGAFSIAVSIGLQYGVPLETFVDKFSDMQFEPRGFTNNEEIRIAKSLPDYIFRFLEQVTKKPLQVVEKTGEEKVETAVVRSSSLGGPPCSKCGNATERSGTCYRCMSCGTTTGCS